MSSAAATHGPREYLFQGALLALLLVALFPTVFFLGEQIVPGGLMFDVEPWRSHAPQEFQPTGNKLAYDALSMFHLYYALCRDLMRVGEWPLWNPLEFMGIPLIANMQSALFYPPRLLHAFLDTFTATTAFILLKLWLCGMTSYVCARGIGLGKPAARFLSVGWMLSSYNLTWCYWAEPDVSAWLPISILGMERLLADRSRQGLCLIAGAGALMLLAGHPESAFSMGLAAALYMALRLGWERRTGRALWKPIGLAAGGWGIALIFSAVQLLPFLEYLANSYSFAFRPEDDATEHALPASAAILMWIPRFFGLTSEQNFWGHQQHSGYTNLIFPGLAVWFGIPCLWLLRRSGSQQRAQAIALLVVCVLCFLMAFNFIGVRFIHRLPVFNAMWYLWYAGPAVFALQLLGALGLDAWFSRPRRLRDVALPALPVVPVVIYAGWMVRSNASIIALRKLDAWVQHQVFVAAVLASLALLILAASCQLRWPRALMGGLTALLAVDLILAVQGVLPTSTRSQLFVNTRLTDYLRSQDQPIRVSTQTSDIPTGYLAAYGIEEWGGYDGMLPLRYMQFSREMDEDAWDAMQPALGVRYFLHAPEWRPLFPLAARFPGRFKQLTAVEGIEVYADTKALDRAFLAGGLEVVPEADDQFNRMRDPAFDPRRTVLTERPVAGAPQPQNPEALGSARVTWHTATKVEVDVRATRDCILVLADAFYPGWSATVDGERAELFPAYTILRGVVIHPGESTVRFRYDPWSFKAGMAVSAAGLTIATLWACYVLLATRRRPAGDK